MPEEYQLLVEGYYQQPPVDSMGYALSIAQPDNSRIYISPKPEVISTRDEPILHSSGKQLKAVDYDPWANLGMAGVEDKSGQSEHPLLKQLFGLAKMTGDQWLGTLANKPGVKPEELQWTGLKDFLEENKGKPVTKEQIQQHLEQNKVELKEVSKGELTDKEILDQSKIRQEDWDKMSQSQKEVIRTNFPNNPTKYHGYQLPGGENYREMLMTLPTKSNSTADMLTLFPSILSEIKTLKDVSLARQHNANFRESFKGVEDKDILDNIALADKLSKTSDYKSSHWDEPNILAHVRMNDRTIEGKKSLHLEEIQSDWHQQGREKGYKGPEPTAEQRAEINRKLMAGEKLTDFENVQLTHVGRVPDAPFKKTWYELALKRMLREAAEKGYDRLSWTPGEAQAARYDLSKSIDRLKATPVVGQHGLKYEIKGYNKSQGDDYATMMHVVPENELPNIVGKEMAKKIVEETEGKKPVNYTGLDLKIGGEGMKGFYDKMIPNALEKMGKEHGVKVKQTEIPVKTIDTFGVYDRGGNLLHEFKTAADAHHWEMMNPVVGGGREVKQISTNKGKQPIHYIDIPQSLMDTVLRKGQPLFSSAHPGVTFSQVDHDPWEKKNATKEK